jgi:uncharacterized membrane protein YciS (DUF1049 family)
MIATADPIHDLMVTGFLVAWLVAAIVWIRHWKTTPRQWVARFFAWRHK